MANYLKYLNNRFLKNKFFWSSIVAIIGLLFSAYIFFAESNLEVRINKVVDLWGKRNEGINLKILLRDSIEIDRKTKNIAVYHIQVKNTGKKILKTMILIWT